MSKHKKKSEEQDWDELPRSRVIRIENVSTIGASTSAPNVLLNSITSDFQFTEENLPRSTLFLCRSVSEDYFSFYVETERKQKSPWKGMHSYIPGRCIQKTEPQSEHPLICLLERFSKEPKLLANAGVFLLYEILPSKHIRIDFYLQHDRVFESILDSPTVLPMMFKKRVHIVMRTIVEGGLKPFDVDVIHDEKGDMDEQRKHGDLNFEKLFDLAEIYKKKNEEPIPNYKLDTNTLNSRLMPYQQDTVRWMIQREAENSIDLNLSWLKFDELPGDPPLFYYSFIGVVARHQPSVEDLQSFSKKYTVKGGLLADEMGLGKTVEVLALISSARKDEEKIIEEDKAEQKPTSSRSQGAPSYTIAEQVRVAEHSYKEMNNAKTSTGPTTYNVEKAIKGKTVNCEGCGVICTASVCGWNFDTCDDELFYCPECMTLKNTRRLVKTTLIIVPESLIFQWFTEVAKHCSDDFKVMFYFGVKKHGYLQPCEMDKFDVVLTTYDTLRREMNFSDKKDQRRNFRTNSINYYLTTSLVHVKFWRVIVDESQVMPQTSTSNLSQMLIKLQGINWWCVTGTPLVRTISDMNPLFTFLDLFPYNNTDFFSNYVHPQYLNFVLQIHDQKELFDEKNPKDLPPILLLEILGRIMSRKMKIDVEHQIDLPELTEIEKRICFSAVEERQYKEEKEKLRDSVARAIGQAADDIFLADLACRDKVLQKFGTLRETLLTGHGNTHDAGSSIVYSPETVIFRLVHNKKQNITSHMRSYVVSSLGLAGVQRLMSRPEDALAVYQHVLDNFNEVSTNTCLKDAMGRDCMTQFKQPSTSQPGVINPNDVLEVEDEEDGVGDVLATKTQQELEQIHNVATMVRSVLNVFKRYTKQLVWVRKQQEGRSDDSDGPPKAKRPRLEDAIRKIQEDEEAAEKKRIALRDQRDAEMEEARLAFVVRYERRKRGEVVEESDEEEKKAVPAVPQKTVEEVEEEERQKHKHKMANLAFKPIRMDATSEFHLIVNMHHLQCMVGIPEEQRIPMQRLGQPVKRFIRLEIQAIKKVQTSLLEFETLWTNDPNHIFEQIESYFDELRRNCEVNPNPKDLYDDLFRVTNTMKNRLADIPYVAIYDEKALKPKKQQYHKSKTCMGGCSESHLECEQFLGQPCLPLVEIVDKLMNQIRLIDTNRRSAIQKLNNLISMVVKMSDPALLLGIFSESSEGKSDELKKMYEIITCKHIIFRGTREEKDRACNFYTKENHPCELCDMWCKYMALCFDSGFMSFHGEHRPKSGVHRFGDVMCVTYEPKKGTAMTFIRHFLAVYFDRIHDSIKTCKLTIDIICELVFRYQELSQAQILLTDDLINTHFGNLSYEVPMELIRAQYAEDHKDLRDQELSTVKSDVKELRYLTNLMKKQLTNETSEYDECPICQCDIDSFMVFTCGHRICPPCYQRLKQMAKAETPHYVVDTLKCPSCRAQNKVQQIMLARSGHMELATTIPGFILSAKLSSAIQIMRNILAADETNKIILFTNVDPASTAVFLYLQKVFRLADLPITTASRQNCGKTIVDFDISDDVKILLCPLSLCANGLNMTGANHIIFLDPPHLQSVLNQAIGRINRFGQRRAMRVYHLVVEGSLDSELRAIAKNNTDRATEKKGWTIGDIRAMFDINKNDPPARYARQQQGFGNFGR
ncbi:hypothetical protein L5515_011074 [Caenorhabditis briggsae]|uniref:Uncharacterized protein n=1 Tax=Caenorhabditis briggsae TaxID=6238 RepID=A0AAE9ETX7_CAEBR|nr:hypothetical protein L5515_011074 [Caenorhabditis briggsae]